MGLFHLRNLKKLWKSFNMQSWKCENCGYQYDGDILEICPSCNNSCGFFDATNYVPVSFSSNEGGSLKKEEKMKVKIYCDPYCPSCKGVTDFLKEKKIRFILINVDENEKAKKEAMSLSGQDKLPIIIVGNDVMSPPINNDDLLALVKKNS